MKNGKFILGIGTGLAGAFILFESIVLGYKTGYKTGAKEIIDKIEKETYKIKAEEAEKESE